MSHEPPDSELFTVPLPAAPPGMPPEQDVVFFRHAVPPPDAAAAGREHEAIMLRRVPAERARRFRAAAGVRGMTHAQYLAALVALHAAIRGRADAGDESLAAELERL